MTILVSTVNILADHQGEVLGLTWGALMLWLGGALGAFTRALLSVTQQTFSRRTLADILVGGATGVILPVSVSILPFSNFDLSKFPFIAQSAIAYFIGASGSFIFTTAGWRFGYIRPETFAERISKPETVQGILVESKEE
jgi:hypothetical protein